MNYRYTPEEIGQLNAEIDRLRQPPSDEVIAAAVEAMMALNATSNGMPFSKLVRQMAIVAIAAYRYGYEQHVEPHAYVPSAMHMGDCSVCGHRQNDPLHDEAV